MSGRPSIDADLVRRLVAAQFPDWAHLDVRPVAAGGWDNRTFHLGEQMSVRLPSARRYAAAVETEHVWLPRLAPYLPVAIPVPLALGAPGEGYPHPWSVRRWLPGDALSAASGVDQAALASDLAGVLAALHAAPADGGPPPGPDSFGRGGPLAHYDAEVEAALAALGDRVDAADCRALWTAARDAEDPSAAVWVHGDVAPGNLLVRDGRLCALIDFGQLCVGDPACDLVMAWTHFDADGRAVFRAALPLAPAAWRRARGWALWKALIVLAGQPGANPADHDRAAAVVRAVLADDA